MEGRIRRERDGRKEFGLLVIGVTEGQGTADFLSEKRRKKCGEAERKSEKRSFHGTG